MPRGNPSLLALLGLVAVAGYQNRDRIGGMLNAARQAQDGSLGDGPRGGPDGRLGSGPGGGLLAELGSLLGPGGPGAGGALSGGLGDLINHLQASGHGRAAQSWVSNESNQPLEPGDMEQAIGDDLLLELQQRTGLPRSELVERLATGLPGTVDHLTPQGRLPTDTETGQFLIGEDAVELREPRQGE